uniref:Uncharacterized protein n=1 Tax=Chromera velia CCMP2878 TaxID=1169474 RepID=A0A0G4FE23_9ALVE|eukprot:Cvel_3237.t1-p1 / transcript=Cvel_3237.t1 / gene=Cvel_3237 / organism=Chromera_velia_CCMP2878 / gene_product=hypothetical protein / transcript_product=hypothetical protein / location=Cvel_scaffold127:6582-10592(-) / protein_length=133 / sequence_SO=supercontig / SO=protein_coding / is_pseudo=false
MQRPTSGGVEEGLETKTSISWRRPTTCKEQKRGAGVNNTRKGRRQFCALPRADQAAQMWDDGQTAATKGWKCNVLVAHPLPVFLHNADGTVTFNLADDDESPEIEITSAEEEVERGEEESSFGGEGSTAVTES